MDLNMPIMDGASATKELKRLSQVGSIDLTKTLIYMHSAIEGCVPWKNNFDGKCKYYLLNNLL
jgi:CheY-like chemotaxis protein